MPSRRKGGVGSSPRLFRPRTPHFVKFVLEGSLQHGKMQIPPSFARKHGHNFSGAVKLKLPNGDVWSVNLELSGGKLWLDKGWRKFQDHYRLKRGSLLLFHLEGVGEGKAGFHVSIFDWSCCEIDYPAKITPGDRTEPSNNSISSESEGGSDDSLMHSASRRSRRGVRSNGGFFRPKSPHFVKVMVTYSIRREKFEIPPKFARKYGGNFSEAVELKVPSDDAWLVKLKLSEGKFWIRNGWKEFQSHYQLETGSLLLFQLDGNSAFQVLIFDPSGMEIDYPRKEDDTDDSLAETESDSESAPIDIDSSSEDSTSGSSPRRPPRSSGKRRRCFREPLPLRSQKALKAAKKFKTNGFSFHIQMRKSNMRCGGLSISKKVMLRADIDKAFHRVELRHDGRPWPVKMLFYNKERQGRLCRGWSDFLKGNRVRAGDVCVFELVKTNVFDVHIFKCSRIVRRSRVE